MQKTPEDASLYRNVVVSGTFEIAVMPSGNRDSGTELLIEHLLLEAGAQPAWRSKRADAVGLVRHVLAFSVPYDVIQSIHRLPHVLYVRKIA